MNPRRKRNLVFALAAANLLLAGYVVYRQSLPGAAAQQAGRKSPPAAAESAGADSARWQYLLDELASEARGLPWEKGQATMVAVVADAYWDLSRGRSERLFKEAFEAAASHSPAGDASRKAALRQIISLAARRDIALAKTFTARLLTAAPREGSERPESLSVALELVEPDAGKAAQLAEAAAPAGPSFDAAWLIMQLARKEPAAAERVYRSYLQAFAAGRGAGLNSLLWLAGFPFGYAEAFGFTPTPGEVTGFNGMRSPRLSPNPALAAAFLQIAFREAEGDLKGAANAPAPQGDVARGRVLFATSYLLPEVARYRPQSAAAWQSLYFQAVAACPPPLREALSKRVQDIFKSRPAADAAGAVEENAAGADAQSALERAEKSTNPCERDREYAKAALAFNSGKDHELALKTADKISAGAVRQSVSQYIYYDMSAEAAGGRDPNAVNDARRYAERVEAADQRAALGLTIAAEALRRGDSQSAAELLSEVKKAAERTQDARAEASILIAAATVFAASDPAEAGRALADALKAVNRSADYRVGGYRFARRVNLACAPGEESWYGGSAPGLNPNLFKALALAAGSDAEEALRLARGIDRATIRIPAVAAVVKAVAAHTRAEGAEGDAK
ncbi:MAG: hypothetical protein M3348_01290 [Acidobacteriota bacterium]|nr:hypothetical protein [Acidobacteriota bacterium]